MSDNKPRVFLSFDFENDEQLKYLFVGQFRLDKSPFDFEDWSAKKARPQSIWIKCCEEKMKKCDLVIVLCGEKTHSCSGVKTEIKIAHNIGLKVFGVNISGKPTIIRPDGIDKKCPRSRNEINKIYIETLRQKNGYRSL